MSNGHRAISPVDCVTLLVDINLLSCSFLCFLSQCNYNIAVNNPKLAKVILRKKDQGSADFRFYSGLTKARN